MNEIVVLGNIAEAKKLPKPLQSKGDIVTTPGLFLRQNFIVKSTEEVLKSIQKWREDTKNGVLNDYETSWTRK